MNERKLRNIKSYFFDVLGTFALRGITSFVLSLIKTYLCFFSFSVGKINHLRNSLVGLSEFIIRDKTLNFLKFLEKKSTFQTVQFTKTFLPK